MYCITLALTNLIAFKIMSFYELKNLNLLSDVFFIPLKICALSFHSWLLFFFNLNHLEEKGSMGKCVCELGQHLLFLPS